MANLAGIHPGEHQFNHQQHQAQGTRPAVGGEHHEAEASSISDHGTKKDKG